VRDTSDDIVRNDQWKSLLKDGKRSGGGGVVLVLVLIVLLYYYSCQSSLAPVLVPFILDELDGMLYKSH
jgi:hypothetical protein